jgi:2EXR family
MPACFDFGFSFNTLGYLQNIPLSTGLSRLGWWGINSLLADQAPAAAAAPRPAINKTSHLQNATSYLLRTDTAISKFQTFLTRRNTRRALNWVTSLRQSATMSTPSTFELFPTLPFELRLKIWDLVLASPRAVTVSCQREKLDRERRFAKAFTSKTPPPALLHVCRESRFEALSTYKPSFKTETSPIYTYVRFEQDEIHCSDSILEYIGEEEVQSIQRMTLDVHDAEYFGHFHMDVVTRMSSLKELSLLTHERQRYNWSRWERRVEALNNDFKEARYTDPGWACPRVRIINSDTGEELGVIEGGALIPGWKLG